MRKPHRKQLLAWLLTAVLLLTNFPISVLSEEIAENPIQAEATEQDEQGIVEEPNPSDFPTEEIGEPTEPPVSEEPNETPEPSEPSGTMEIPADENTPDIPDQDESETPEPSDSDIEETPSPEVPEETPDTDSTDEPSIEDVSAEETSTPKESPFPDDEEAFSVSEALLEYGYAYAAVYAESVIYEDTDLTTPLFTLKEDGGVLLITEETETAFKVWWLTYADEPLSGYENAREFERDHLITDKSGYAKTKLLPYGVYVLEQTVGRDGFEIKKPLLFEITGEETPIQPPILTLNDRPILYRLRLIKTDARTGKVITVAGASFKLKDADGNIVAQTIYYPKKQTLDTFTTDESGCVTLPEEVGWGLYSIEEIQASEGYLIRTESLPVFVGETGDTADQVYELDIEIPNEAVMGQISLEKKGLQLVGFETQTEMGFEYQSPVFEERCLAGAVFEVHAAEDIVGGDGTFWYQKDEWVDTITTSGTGADWSKELPLGKYKLMEIAAPEGYVLSDEVYEVELKSIDGHTPLVTVTVKAHNEYLSAEIRLEKEKEILKPYTDENGYTRQELTTTYGLGFVFGLYNADDIHYADGTDNPAPCRSATAHCYR